MRGRRALVMRSAAIAAASATALFAGVGVSVAATAAPPTATTGSVSSVYPKSAVVTGTVDPRGLATSWEFEYGLSTSATYGSATPPKNAGTGRLDVGVSATLVGLSPATSYRYRIVATSSAGRVYGGSGIFNTSAAPAVVTAAASHIAAASATLSAIVNPEALVTHWYFQYGKTTAYGSKTPTVTLAAGPSDADVSAPISGLGPRTTYHFRIVATSSAGEQFGSDMSLTTGLSVTMNASVSSVVFGGFVHLLGTVANGRAGDRVTVLSKRYNETTFSGIGAITTGTGGAWSFPTQPSARTTYEAAADNGMSSPLVVSVGPAVYLTVNRGGSLSTRVVGASSFASHVLQLQRLSNGLWVTWKHVLLNGSAQARFSTSLPKGRTTIRMAIGPFVVGIDQAAPGYLAGYSRALSYRVG